MRLQKYLAHCGVCSRRKAEEVIKSGIVFVNGKIETDFARDVDINKDVVKIENKIIRPVKKIYIVLNKPRGCISSLKDEKNRPTVIDVIGGKIKERIYPVGRLDFNTTGCLLLTNDGDWAEKIIHPKYEIEKEYLVKIKGNLTDSIITKLMKGIFVEGKRLKAKKIWIRKKLEKNYIVSVIITQGINHQIKKMFSYVGLTVLRLNRDRVGIVSINNLQPGQWRYLTEKEVEYFKGNVKNCRGQMASAKCQVLSADWKNLK